MTLSLKPFQGNCDSRGILELRCLNSLTKSKFLCAAFISRSATHGRTPQKVLSSLQLLIYGSVVDSSHPNLLGVQILDTSLQIEKKEFLLNVPRPHLPHGQVCYWLSQIYLPSRQYKLLVAEDLGTRSLIGYVRRCDAMLCLCCRSRGNIHSTSLFVFSYCKQSKPGGGNGLKTRLQSLYLEGNQEGLGMRLAYIP